MADIFFKAWHVGYLFVLIGACNTDATTVDDSVSVSPKPSSPRRVAASDDMTPEVDREKFEKSNVSQLSLDHLLASTKRIVVRKSEVHDKILYESNKKPDLALLEEVLRIVPPGPKAVPCRCVGSPVIELYFRKRYVGWIALHDNMAIRTSAWNSDAKLAEPERFIKWFERRGVAEPRRRSLFLTPKTRHKNPI